MSNESANAVTDHPSTGAAQAHADAPDNPAENGFDRGIAARLNRISIAILLALAIAFVAAVQSATGLSDSTTSQVSEGRLGGDFPAFYAAGAIALDGDFDELYVAERQRAEQVGLGLDGYLAFAYPPYVAVGYAPLAALSFRAGYALHTLLMAGALVGALALLRKPVPIIGQYWLPSIAASLAFYPVFRAVGGGQNTAITILLIAAVWRFLDDDRDLAAGIAAGLLLFRPQYALPLIGLMALSRRWRAVGGAAGVGAALWLATASFMGSSWVTRWLDQVVPFVETDAEVNAGNSISILGFLHAVLGSDSSLALVVGLMGASLVAGLLSWIWLHPERFDLPARMGVAAMGMLLMSPHTMFYDAGLLTVAACAFLASHTGDGLSGRTLGVLGAGWVAVLVHPLFAESLRATPLALVVLGLFILFAHHHVGPHFKALGVQHA